MLTVEKPKSSTKALIVLLAFVRAQEGGLRVAFEPREAQSEDKARTDARRMAALGTYAGVIAWSRSADLVNGEFGAPVVIFQHGDVPELE